MPGSNWSTAPSYNSTTLQLYNSKTLHLYITKTLHLYNATTLQLYNSTTICTTSFTTVQIFLQLSLQLDTSLHNFSTLVISFQVVVANLGEDVDIGAPRSCPDRTCRPRADPSLTHPTRTPNLKPDTSIPDTPQDTWVGPPQERERRREGGRESETERGRQLYNSCYASSCNEP